MNGRLAGSDTWDFIAPAMPDSLEELGNGHYLAKWWKPVPMHEIQLLLQVEGITVHSGPYEPKNLPEGLAVRFSIQSEAAADEPNGMPDKTFAVESRRRSSPLPLQKTGT